MVMHRSGRRALAAAVVAVLGLGLQQQQHEASAAVSLQPLATFGGGDGFIQAGDAAYPYMPVQTGSAGAYRGVAYNPITNNVYLLSRVSAASGQIAILNGDTGAESSLVTLGGISEGAFPTNLVRVADDGAIYVSNLTTSASAAGSFRVYRYANEAALVANTPTLAFEGELTAGTRYGDSFNVRGGGANTQFVVGGGNANDDLVIFNTADGLTYTPTIYTLPGITDSAHGVAFGAGNTVYTKQAADSLRLFSFDGVGGTANFASGGLTLIDASQTSDLTDPLVRVAAIDTDIANNLLAGLSIPGGTAGTGGPRANNNTNAAGTQDSTRLYSVDGADADLPQLDSESFLFQSANQNLGGTLDIAGGRLYVLDTGAGLQAFEIIPEPTSLALLAAGGLAVARRRRR